MLAAEPVQWIIDGCELIAHAAKLAQHLISCQIQLQDRAGIAELYDWIAVKVYVVAAPIAVEESPRSAMAHLSKPDVGKEKEFGRVAEAERAGAREIALHHSIREVAVFAALHGDLRRPCAAHDVCRTSPCQYVQRGVGR